MENLWICEQSPPFTQTIFGSLEIYTVNLVTQAVWSGSIWAVHVQDDTYSACEWRRLKSVCAFDTSLASQRFCHWFCLPETFISESMTKTDSGQSAHHRSLYAHHRSLCSKSLASLERCMCGKEVIRTTCASLICRCGEFSRSSTGLLN